jgi:VCBS repeat-containing protein
MSLRSRQTASHDAARRIRARHLLAAIAFAGLLASPIARGAARPDSGEATALEPQADLGIAVRVPSNPILYVGDVVTYSVEVTNYGPDVAGATQLALTFGPNDRVLWWSPACSFDGVGPMVCSLGEVPPFQPTFVEITSRLLGTGAAGPSVQQLTSDAQDPNGANNFPSSLPSVNTASVNLGLTVLDRPDPVPNRNLLAYTILLTNRGPNAARDVIVELQSSAGGLTFVSTTPDGTWEPGETSVCTAASASYSSCTLGNVALASSGGAIPGAAIFFLEPNATATAQVLVQAGGAPYTIPLTARIAYSGGGYFWDTDVSDNERNLDTTVATEDLRTVFMDTPGWTSRGSAFIDTLQPRSGDASLRLEHFGMGTEAAFVHTAALPGLGILGELTATYPMGPAAPLEFRLSGGAYSVNSGTPVPKVALRVYPQGDTRSFFLATSSQTCGSAGCLVLADGWVRAHLTGWEIEPADGNPPPASFADVPYDAPIVGVEVRSSGDGGASPVWVDNVTIPRLGGLSGITWTFDVPAGPTETPVGTNVVVRPLDQNRGARVTLVFANVQAPGDTTLTTVPPTSPPPPAGFQLGDPAVYYEISTTANYTGDIQLCFNYTGISYPDEAALKLLHYEGGAWIDHTTSLDTTFDVICGTTTSLSPFLLASQGGATLAVNAGSDQTLDEGSALSLSASFTDPDTGDTHTASVDWGDGSPVQPLAVSESGGAGTLSASHVYAWDGPFSVTVEVCAQRGVCDSDSLVATVQNAAPVAASQSVTVTEDQDIGITLAATDPGGDSVTYTIVSYPAHGSLSGGAPAVVYRPAANYSGSDSFTFQASDGAASSNVATVTITVTPVPDLPTAVADAYSVASGQTLNVAAPGVLENDSDPDGDSITATLVSGPAHGTLTLAADGSFTYLPDAGFDGADSFVYRASDGGLASNDGAVTINVVGVNDAPVAINDSFSLSEDGVSTGNVLVNDSDPDGDALSVVLVAGVANGTLALNADGSFTYTPNPNFSGSDGFTYRARDAALDSNVATVTIQVIDINDPAVARDDSFSIAEDGGSVSGNVLANDSDVENGIHSAVPVSPPAHGTLSWTGAGGFTYTPNANFFGSDSFTYQAYDSGGPSNVATVTITVTPVNDAPVANSEEFFGTEDAAPVSGNVLVNDTDVEGTALTATLVTLPQYGTLAFNSNGSFTYTPNPNFYGSDAFEYRISDGELTATNAAFLYIENVNDAPAAANDAFVLNEDEPRSGNVRFNDADSDTLPWLLTVTLVGGPAHGTLTLNSDGSFTYTPSPNYFGGDAFAYKLSDGEFESNVATASLTINAVNDQPQPQNDAFSTLEDAAVSGNVLANDSDADGDALSAVLLLGVEHGTLALNPDGSFTYTPAANFAGSDRFVYRASDGTPGWAPAEVILTVAAVNDAPILSPVGPRTVTEGQLLEITLAASDPDGGPVTYEASGLPPGATFDGGSGVFRYTAGYETSGAAGNAAFEVTFRVRDSASALDEEAVAITVLDVPSATPPGEDVVVEPTDQNGARPVTLTFDNIVSEGTTTVVTTGPEESPPPPAGYQLGEPPTFYDVTTTATFSGAIQLCFSYGGISFADEATLRLFHYEGGAWIDVTVSLDTVANVICGRTTSCRRSRSCSRCRVLPTAMETPWPMRATTARLCRTPARPTPTTTAAATPATRSSTTRSAACSRRTPRRPARSKRAGRSRSSGSTRERTARRSTARPRRRPCRSTVRSRVGAPTAALCST